MCELILQTFYIYIKNRKKKNNLCTHIYTSPHPFHVPLALSINTIFFSWFLHKNQSTSHSPLTSHFSILQIYPHFLITSFRHYSSLIKPFFFNINMVCSLISCFSLCSHKHKFLSVIYMFFYGLPSFFFICFLFCISFFFHQIKFSYTSFRTDIDYTFYFLHD